MPHDVFEEDESAGATATNGSWLSPTIASPWSNGATTFQYMKDAIGFVHIRGSVTAAAIESSVAITTLPAGFRPGTSDYYPGIQTGGVAGIVYITTAGVIDGTISTANNQLRFNGLCFLAEN